MKMITSNLLRNVLSICLFLASMGAVASTAKRQSPLRQDGPEPPPGAPIDSHTIILLIMGLVIARIYFYNQTKMGKLKA